VLATAIVRYDEGFGIERAETLSRIAPPEQLRRVKFCGLMFELARSTLKS
jgi:hypothetical protein